MPLQEVSRINKIGASIFARIPRKLFDHLAWRDDDRLVCSVIGTKLILQRVELERFGKLSLAEDGGSER